MKILALVRKNSGVDYHRLLLPLRHLPLTEGDSILVASNTKALNPKIFEDVDIVTWCRMCPFDLDAVVKYKKMYGFKIVVDIDDFWILPHNHILYMNYLHDDTAQKTVKSMLIADLVVVTHELLAKKVRAVNSHVVVIPNALPYGKDQFVDTRDPRDVILYACTPTHLTDLRTVVRALELCRADKLVQEYSFSIAGFNANTEASARVWVRIRNMGAVFGNFKELPHLPLDMYMLHYRYAKIAIAPLEENEFNKHKSNLKALEAGCVGIPLITPPFHPYDEVPTVKCANSRDWYLAIRKLVMEPNFAADKGAELYSYVREHHDLNKVNIYRKQIFDGWKQYQHIS